MSVRQKLAASRRAKFAREQRFVRFPEAGFRKGRPQRENPAMREPRLDDPDLPLADMMRQWPATVPVFFAHGMLCVGCLIGPFHTIDDACAEYGLDPESLLAELRDAVRVAAGPEAPAGAARPR
jgi:hybrid cluster-associated redox disulfide protein